MDTHSAAGNLRLAPCGLYPKKAGSSPRSLMSRRASSSRESTEIPGKTLETSVERISACLLPPSFKISISSVVLSRMLINGNYVSMHLFCRLFTIDFKKAVERVGSEILYSRHHFIIEPFQSFINL